MITTSTMMKQALPVSANNIKYIIVYELVMLILHHDYVVLNVYKFNTPYVYPLWICFLKYTDFA